MKKVLFFLIIIINFILAINLIYLFFIKKGDRAEYLGIPKGYIEKYEYWDEEGFQDYTDYAKYIYSNKDIVIMSDGFKIVKEEDIDRIKEYFENFYDCMKSLGRLDQYDFKIEQINEGDYIMEKKVEKWNTTYESTFPKEHEFLINYSILYFDTETKTLYYIHNNI